MSELVRQLRADVRHRPTMLFLLVAAAALVAAVAWVAMGAKAPSTSTPSVAPPPITPPAGQNVADGASSKVHKARVKHAKRRHSPAHAPKDPFTELVKPTKKSSGEKNTKGVETSGSSSSTSSKAPSNVANSESKTTGGSSSGGSSKHGSSPGGGGNSSPQSTSYALIALLEWEAESDGGPFALKITNHDGSHGSVIKAAAPPNAPALLTLKHINQGSKSIELTVDRDVSRTSGGRCLAQTPHCTTLEMKVGETAHFTWRRGEEPEVEFEVLLRSISRRSAGSTSAVSGRRLRLRK